LTQTDSLRDKLQSIDLADWKLICLRSINVFLALGIFYFGIAGVLFFIEVAFNRPFLGFFRNIALGFGGLHGLLFLMGRRKPFPALIIGLMLYAAHTSYEYFTYFNPVYWMPKPTSEDGWIGFAPFLIEALPYLYYILRIALVILLVRGIYFSFKVKRYQ